MISAEVVDGADQIHPVVQGDGAASQGPAPAGEGRQALAEGSIKPFNVGGVDHAGAALRAAPELLDLSRPASENTALDTHDAAVGVMLDDLRNLEGFPVPPARPTRLACRKRITKGFPEGTGVGPKSIRAEQQRGTSGTPTDPRQEGPHQPQVPLLTDLPGQPQPLAYTHRQRHPANFALLLNADLIGLHLAQRLGLFDQVFLHGLGLPPCPCKPRRHRPLIKAKGDHDGLQGTAMRQEGEDQADGLHRRTQAVEDRPFPSREGGVALLADQALLLARVNANVALPGLASSWAVKIGTKCVSEVHASPPGVDLAFAKSRAGPPFLLQIRFSTL